MKMMRTDSVQPVHSAHPGREQFCKSLHEAVSRTQMAREDQRTIRLLEGLSKSIDHPGPASTPSIEHGMSTYAVVRSDLIQLKDGEDIEEAYVSFVSIGCINLLHLQMTRCHPHPSSPRLS